MGITTTKILLIEDDEEDFILLRKHLSRISSTSYEIVWETSPQVGLERMFEDEHALCMLDYRLGSANGIEIIESARGQGYTKPIILLTGASEGEIDIQALQAGADDYIDKGQLQSELLYRIIRYAIERKKAEHERENLLREQIASRELEERRNEFISMVVHELKTPVTSIKGYAQLLRRRFAKVGDDTTVHMVTRMDAQLTKLTELINDFQDVTRISGGKLQFREDYFSFDELVHEMVAELQVTTERQSIICEGVTEKTIWGDRMRIGQVITNFLTNAIKYAQDADKIMVRSSLEGEHVVLRVQDFGPGIPKDAQDKIFDPFYRVEHPVTSSLQSIPGLGLGLHIAAEIIQRQDGNIWVESEVGEGATFCFSLPVNRHAEVSIEEFLT